MPTSNGISVVPLHGVLLVSTGAEFHDQLARDLQHELTARVRALGSRAVVLDISAVQVIDSYITRVLGDVAQAVRFLGARCVLVGMRPAVAMSLVEMGIELPGVATALNLEMAMARLGIGR